MGQGDLEKFITGSVGYVQVTDGKTASFEKISDREMNCIEAEANTAVSVKQYENFTDGDVTLLAGAVRFGKFYEVTVTGGSVIIYSQGGAPAIA